MFEKIWAGGGCNQIWDEVVSYQPTDQHCLQHQGPQPIGRYCQLSASLPALLTASGTPAVSRYCQLSAHLPALPTASGTQACWQVLIIVSYQPTYQHCLQHQEPQPVGRYCQLSAHLTSIAYSIRNPSLLEATHNCQLSAHVPALPTAWGTPACWQVLSAISPLNQHCLQHQEPKPVGRLS